MKRYILIGLIFEFVLAILAGCFVDRGCYGAATILVSCILINAIYNAAMWAVYQIKKS